MRLNSTLNKLPVLVKFTVILLDFIFLLSSTIIIILPHAVNQYMRTPVSEFLLSDGNNSVAKSVSYRIRSVKQYAATPTVLLLYTPDQS